ncbi:MAG: hypothetical protein ACRDOU_07345 [Streptosporangiaceae bacterium]
MSCFTNRRRGLAFTGHTAAVAILALTQPTSTFVAFQHPAGLPFPGFAIAALCFTAAACKPASAPPRSLSLITGALDGVAAAPQRAWRMRRWAAR